MALYKTPLKEKVGASLGQKDVKSCIPVTASVARMGQVYSRSVMFLCNPSLMSEGKSKGFGKRSSAAYKIEQFH